MHKTVQIEMCLLLNCSHETYSNILYKYGRAYLHWYLPCNERQRRKLEGSQIFWAWFRLQFEIHDDALINDPEFPLLTINERRRWFKNLHCPQAMANEVKPNAVVLAELNKKEPICQ
jgi:hypothetical protein